jgi:hypothetical protein
MRILKEWMAMLDFNLYYAQAAADSRRRVARPTSSRPTSSWKRVLLMPQRGAQKRSGH